VNSTAIGKPNATSATWLFTQVSLDNGKSWELPQLVSITDAAGDEVPPVACSMCMTSQRFHNGVLHIGFRTANNNIREFNVIKGSALHNHFSSNLAGTPWPIDYCPMNGPELSVSASMGYPNPASMEVVAIMEGSRNNVFWSTSVSEFKTQVPTPTSEANERFPTAVATGEGDMLFVWNVGPMAVAGTSLVKYACYDAANGTRWIGQGGTIGTSFAGTKATALATGPSTFLILTTAE
jgi:hypothetical protein